VIAWLSGNQPFPDAEMALGEPNGLLAAGGDLSPGRLLDAYRNGIFPWYSAGQPILWWSPDPRMVLLPDELRVSRSLAKILRRGGYAVRADTCFERVMRECAAPRGSEAGTWITDEMISAYATLHRLGHAHSVETWIDGELAGGLYGVAIGRAFFGESMFTRAPDASKIALVHLTRDLQRRGLGIIDCQMNTAHLARFGAREIPRSNFLQRVKDLVHYPAPPGPWILNDVVSQ
jgi:leucyl/phenylalanyl-tRNA--protein transferase